MEEARGLKGLLDLEEPKYTVEQIAAKMGKTPAYVTTRLKLTDLAPQVIEAFYAEEVGVGHALLLAKLPQEQQEQALTACYGEVYNGGTKPTRVLLPVRNLQFWIDTNILLLLKDAPFSKRDAQLVPAAGSCADCPKRTGHNKLLFADDLGRQGDQCTDPTCYQAKMDAHVAKSIAAKPELVQISTAYGQQKNGSAVLPRNKYTVIRDDRPKSKDEAKHPEFKDCKFTAEAIITEGTDVGTVHKVCANASCPVHHPKQKTSRDDESGRRSRRGTCASGWQTQGQRSCTSNLALPGRTATAKASTPSSGMSSSTVKSSTRSRNCACWPSAGTSTTTPSGRTPRWAIGHQHPKPG